MRSRILFSHKLLLFCLVTLLLLFSGICFNVADAVSTGTVNFIGSEITPNIPEGAHYQHNGHRKVSNNVEVTAEGDSRRVVLEEKWKSPLGKPPDITIFTLKVTAKGQGRILLTLNNEGRGGPTINKDVGSYRKKDNPYSLENDTDFFLKHYVPHENIREYEDGFDMPYDDACVPVKHKGYDLEVVTGTEGLRAKGKVFAEKVSISYGTERSAQQALGLTGGWGSAAIEANFVYGTKSTWGWKLIEHPNNTTTPAEINSSFHVKVKDIIQSSYNYDSTQAGNAQTPECVECENCDEFVHHKDDHYLGLCPIDASVAGCGEKRWSCETVKQLAWHKIRDCYNNVIIPLPLTAGAAAVCPESFRHCKNSDCDYRIKPKRGHSDGTVSDPPPGVANLTSESHLFASVPDPVPSETVNNTPDCSSCTDGCSACPSTTTSIVQTLGLHPVNGSTYYGYGGDRYEVKLTTSEAYSKVYWYIKPPGDTTMYGNQVEIDYGDGSTTTATLIYTLPSSNGGTYRITAYIYYSDRIAEETYDVYVY